MFCLSKHVPHGTISVLFFIGAASATLATHSDWGHHTTKLSYSLDEARSEWRRLRADGFRPAQISDAAREMHAAKSVAS